MSRERFLVIMTHMKKFIQSIKKYICLLKIGKVKRRAFFISVFSPINAVYATEQSIIFINQDELQTMFAPIFSTVINTSDKNTVENFPKELSEKIILWTITGFVKQASRIDSSVCLCRYIHPENDQMRLATLIKTFCYVNHALYNALHTSYMRYITGLCCSYFSQNKDEIMLSNIFDQEKDISSNFLLRPLYYIPSREALATYVTPLNDIFMQSFAYTEAERCKTENAQGSVAVSELLHKCLKWNDVTYTTYSQEKMISSYIIHFIDKILYFLGPNKAYFLRCGINEGFVLPTADYMKQLLSDNYICIEPVLLDEHRQVRICHTTTSVKKLTLFYMITQKKNYQYNYTPDDISAMVQKLNEKARIKSTEVIGPLLAQSSFILRQKSFKSMKEINEVIAYRNYTQNKSKKLNDHALLMTTDLTYAVEKSLKYDDSVYQKDPLEAIYTELCIAVLALLLFDSKKKLAMSLYMNEYIIPTSSVLIKSLNQEGVIINPAIHYQHHTIDPFEDRSFVIETSYGVIKLFHEITLSDAAKQMYDWIKNNKVDSGNQGNIEKQSNESTVSDQYKLPSSKKDVRRGEKVIPHTTINTDPKSTPQSSDTEKKNPTEFLMQKGQSSYVGQSEPTSNSEEHDIKHDTLVIQDEQELEQNNYMQNTEDSIPSLFDSNTNTEQKSIPQSGDTENNPTELGQSSYVGQSEPTSNSEEHDIKSDTLAIQDEQELEQNYIQNTEGSTPSLFNSNTNTEPESAPQSDDTAIHCTKILMNNSISDSTKSQPDLHSNDDTMAKRSLIMKLFSLLHSALFTLIGKIAECF